MPKPTQPLPPRLMRAFDRLAARGDPPEPPPWGRTIRLATDYSLRVAIDNIRTDTDADAIAALCLTLGLLEQRDPKGDPPATVTAQERAGRAGADCGRAFDLLGQVRDGSDEWARRGWPVPTLADHTMRILQRAARGERVRDDVLASVLEAAEHVAGELGWRLLATSHPIGTTHLAGLNQPDLS